MTLEEKLANFKTSAINDANMQSNKIIHDSEETIKNNLEEYESRSKEDFDNKLKIETSMLVSKKNQDITKDTLKVKQKVEQKRVELIDELFIELENKLRDFKNTNEYKELLVKQIEEVKKIAKEDKFIVYIDKTDSNIIEELSSSTGTYIEVSKNNIMGGIKAIIEEKKILLDYSFRSKMQEEKADFVF